MCAYRDGSCDCHRRDPETRTSTCLAAAFKHLSAAYTGTVAYSCRLAGLNVVVASITEVMVTNLVETGGTTVVSRKLLQSLVTVVPWC